MEKAMSFSESFNCHGAQEVCCPLQEFKQNTDAGNLKQSDFIATADWVDVYRLSNQCDQDQPNPLEDCLFSSKGLESFTNSSVSYEVQIDAFSTAIQSLKAAVKDDARHNIKQDKLYENENVLPTYLPSLEIPKSHMLKNEQLSVENMKVNKTSWATKRERELSTVDVMKVAAACYIQCSAGMENKLSTLEGPYSCQLPSLTGEEFEDVELVHLLLASAEKIGNQLYDRAGNLLAQCTFLSSNVGRPVQRVVYYFADALKERINRETGRISLKQSVGNGRTRLGEEMEEMITRLRQTALACHQVLPTSQVAKFTEVQAIIENMASAKRIHFIDLSIRFGIQWSILMQALAVRPACPVELLKITAVGTFAERIAETGRQLESFAEMLKLPFGFKAVIVSDMTDIKEDLFEIEDGEAVGVYASMVLKTMLNKPDCLEHVLRVIRKLNPCIMAITEVEGNHNSCSFFNRFIEALFYFSAWFDCLDDCMDRNDCNRLSVEGKFFSLSIQSIVATEGNERVIRHVGIDLWRSFFTRFGFIEMELSVALLYQASLVAKQFACDSSLNLDMNGKSLTIGWKGTPLISFSAWKLR